MRILVTCMILVGMASCYEREDRLFIDEDIQSIADYLEKNSESYSRFIRIVEQGELMGALSAYNPYGDGFTLFLPTDEAFDRFIQTSEDYESFDELLLDTLFVRFLGRYHLVNIRIQTNDFPLGSLPDTTASGDILYINMNIGSFSTVYTVNDAAQIIQPNLKMDNGYIHVISEVLKPVDFSGYDWIKTHPEYSILAGVLELTGFKGKLGINKKYTILAEHDSIYKRYGIDSLGDLIDIFATPGYEYNSTNNSLYQFAAFHVIQGSYYLEDLTWGTRNYRTYSNKNVKIELGMDIKINSGDDTLRLDISENGDTTAITHIEMFYNIGNVLTKTGAIHFITELMYFYMPPRPQRIFSFQEEPVILQVSEEPGSYFFYEEEQADLEVISWTGPDSILYYKSSGKSGTQDGTDFLEINGEFEVNYHLPRILPGKYSMKLSAHAWDSEDSNATILVYLDGNQLAGAINLNSGGKSAETPFRNFNLGAVEFFSYGDHVLTIRSVESGRLRWESFSIYPEG